MVIFAPHVGAAEDSSSRIRSRGSKAKVLNFLVSGSSGSATVLDVSYSILCSLWQTKPEMEMWNDLQSSGPLQPLKDCPDDHVQDKSEKEEKQENSKATHRTFP